MRGPTQPNPPQLDKGSFLQNGETVFTFSSLTQMLRGHTPFHMFRFWKWGPVDKMGTSWLAFVDKAWYPYSWQSCVKWDGGRRLKLIFRISCDSVTILRASVTILLDSALQCDNLAWKSCVTVSCQVIWCWTFCNSFRCLADTRWIRMLRWHVLAFYIVWLRKMHHL